MFFNQVSFYPYLILGIILFKNINTDSNNSTNFKNKQTVELIPTLQTNYFFPLKKETKSFNNIMTPRLSLRISLPTTKDISKKLYKEGKIKLKK